MDSRIERPLKVLEHIPEYCNELRDMNLPDSEIKHHLMMRVVCSLEKIVWALDRSWEVNRSGHRPQTKLKLPGTL